MKLSEQELGRAKVNAAAKVARGAAILDEKIPGWETRIDLSRLELQDTCRCVLGQLYGDYFIGKHAIGITEAFGNDYGFDGYQGVWAVLDEAWIDLIKARHDQGFPAGSLSSSSGLVQR